MVYQIIKIKRTETPNNPPTGLAPGELAVELATPTRLWVGVPTSLDASGKKLLIDASTGFVPLSGGTMTGPLTLNGNPTVALHAVPKQYVDALNVTQYLPKAGGTMTGFLTLLPDAPTFNEHATNKAYVDGRDNAVIAIANAKVAKGGDVMTGLLTLSGDPSSAMHAATKQYVDSKPTGILQVDADARYINVTGDTMNGALTLWGAPTQPLHAATMQYVDLGLAQKASIAYADTKVAKAGDTMSGPLSTALNRGYGLVNTNMNTSFQNTPAGTKSYGADGNGEANAPAGGWWFHENYRHSNASNYWGMQVAWGWEDHANELWTRNVSGGTFGAWVKYLNSVNFSSYALPLQGGTISGSLTVTGAVTLNSTLNVSGNVNMGGQCVLGDTWPSRIVCSGELFTGYPSGTSRVRFGNFAADIYWNGSNFDFTHSIWITGQIYSTSNMHTRGGLLYFGTDDGVYWNDERGNARLASNQNVYSYGYLKAGSFLMAVNGNVYLSDNQGVWLRWDGYVSFSHPIRSNAIDLTYPGMTYSGDINIRINYNAGVGRWYVSHPVETPQGVLKVFLIDHPIDKDRYLIHACLEGPTADVFYRGKADLDYETEIELPHYFTALCDESTATVIVTPVHKRGELFSGQSSHLSVTEVENGKFSVVCPDGRIKRFHWEVKAARKDSEQILVEPLRSEIDVFGDGPYRHYRKKH